MPEPHWSGKNPPTTDTGGSGTLSGLSDVTGQPLAGSGPVYDATGNAPLVPVVTTADLDAILASVAAVNWRTLNLQPGFTPYGQGFADPRYRLTLNNVVHVEGMVACSPPLSDTDVGKVIATVAIDSLPGGRVLFSAPAFGNSARIDVSPTGDLEFQGMLIGGGQIDWFSISMITYSVDAAIAAAA